VPWGGWRCPLPPGLASQPPWTRSPSPHPPGPNAWTTRPSSTFQTPKMSPRSPCSALETVPWGAAPHLGSRSSQPPSTSRGWELEPRAVLGAGRASRRDEGCRSPDGSHTLSVSAQGGVNDPEWPLVPPGGARGQAGLAPPGRAG